MVVDMLVMAVMEDLPWNTMVDLDTVGVKEVKSHHRQQLLKAVDHANINQPVTRFLEGIGREHHAARTIQRR